MVRRTEHQGHGTPHGHGQAHVVCIYQFCTLPEIVDKIQKAWDSSKDATLVQDMRRYHEWLHVEQPLDEELHAQYEGVAEQQFFDGFSARENAPLVQTPAFLQEDAELVAGLTLAAAYVNVDVLPKLAAEGRKFAAAYRRDAQFVFSRVQHHVHKKDKDGNYVPLHACLPKSSRKRKGIKCVLCKCKADFPKSNVITTQTVLVCQGLAKKFKLRVSGRRNALGCWQGVRTESWQSGTTPGFAVHFRSNSHTGPNYRVPPIACVHEPSCPSAACKARAQNMLGSLDVKKISRLMQRVQRETTGYYCGYTFKGQIVGRKYLLQASKSLDYMEDGLKDKSEGQRMHRVTNRLLVDMQHRCIARPAAEEWNLATFAHDQDVTNAEFMRTFMSVAYPGGQLLKRLEDEMSILVSIIIVVGGRF